MPANVNGKDRTKTPVDHGSIDIRAWVYPACLDMSRNRGVLFPSVRYLTP